MVYDKDNIIELAGKILDGHEEFQDRYSLAEQVLDYFKAQEDRNEDVWSVIHIMDGILIENKVFGSKDLAENMFSKLKDKWDYEIDYKTHRSVYAHDLYLLKSKVPVFDGFLNIRNILKASSNCFYINTLGKHTHTFFYADKESNNDEKGFEEIRIQHSTYPEGYEGKEVALHTFDNGTLIIELPKNSKFSVNVRPE
jgi:hypothetical protein